MAPLHRAATAPSDPQGAQMVQLDQGAAQMIQHFTHPHPLQHVQMSQEFKCNGCNIIGKGPRYNCPSCDFHLHEQCARCPLTLLSPNLHPRHQLTLVNVPGKSHFCDLCGAIADGMFYTCEECDIDVHPLCTQLPLQVQHAFHPQHPLTLQPGHPSSCCNVCNQRCGTWRYKCNECNHVDVHLNCVVGSKQVQGGHLPTTQVPQQAVGHPNGGGSGNIGTNQPVTNYPQTNQLVGHPSGGTSGNYGTNQPNTNYQTTQAVGHPSSGGGNYEMNQPTTNFQMPQAVGHPSGSGGNYGTNQPVTNYQTTQAVEHRSGSGGNYGTNQPINNYPSYQTTSAVGHLSGRGGNYEMNQPATNYQMPQAMGHPSGGGNYATNQPITNYQSTQVVGHPSGGGGNYGANQHVTNYQITQAVGHPSSGNYGMNQSVTNSKGTPIVGYVDDTGGNYVNSQLATNYQTTQTVGYPGGNYVNSQLATNYQTIPVRYSVGGVGGNIGNNQALVPVYQTQGSGNGRKNSGGQLASKLGKFAVNVVSTSIIGVPLISTQKNRLI